MNAPVSAARSFTIKLSNKENVIFFEASFSYYFFGNSRNKSIPVCSLNLNEKDGWKAL